MGPSPSTEVGNVLRPWSLFFVLGRLRWPRHSKMAPVQATGHTRAISPCCGHLSQLACFLLGFSELWVTF